MSNNLKNNLHTGKWWWAYLDDTGTIRVLPYIDDAIIQRTEQLPFTRGIFEPFTAPSKHAAQLKIAEWLTQEQIQESKKNSWTKQFMESPEGVQ